MVDNNIIAIHKFQPTISVYWWWRDPHHKICPGRTHSICKRCDATALKIHQKGWRGLTGQESFHAAAMPREIEIDVGKQWMCVWIILVIIETHQMRNRRTGWGHGNVPLSNVQMELTRRLSCCDTEYGYRMTNTCSPVYSNYSRIQLTTPAEMRFARFQSTTPVRARRYR